MTTQELPNSPDDDGNPSHSSSWTCLGEITVGNLRLEEVRYGVNLYVNCERKADLEQVYMSPMMYTIFNASRGWRAVQTSRKVWRGKGNYGFFATDDTRELFMCTLIPGEYKVTDRADGGSMLWWLDESVLKGEGNVSPKLCPEVAARIPPKKKGRAVLLRRATPTKPKEGGK